MEINNLSTYATWTSLVVMLLQVICKYLGLEIGVNELTIIANAIISIIIAIWSSYNPNTIAILGNAPAPDENTGDTDDTC